MDRIRVHAGIPWRLTHGPDGVRAPAPILGADTDEVLLALDYTPAEIARLRSDKILY